MYKLSNFVTREDSIDTYFGKAVGIGVQSLLLGESREQCIWRMFLSWSGDLLSASDSAKADKKKKHFWHTIAAIDNFNAVIKTTFKDWEVAVFKGKPAVELSFRVDFGDGFVDRGHVDVVLRHRVTKMLRVLEVKTTGDANVLEAKYGNSQQGVGYGVILDTIAKQYEEHSSSYEVLYLVYKTTRMEWEVIPFVKTYLQRAQWIKQVMIDIQKIELYSRGNYWPMHGENCVRFFRECDYYGTCNMGDKVLFRDVENLPVKPDTRENGEPVEYVFDLHILDLIAAQEEGK